MFIKPKYTNDITIEGYNKRVNMSLCTSYYKRTYTGSDPELPAIEFKSTGITWVYDDEEARTMELSDLDSLFLKYF